MNQIEQAARFASLHVKGDPVVLYNIWDAGGAKALEKAGAQAVATGSWSVAAAHGYSDGEAIPLELVEVIARRICTTTALPVTIDFEGGYAQRPEGLARNVKRIIEAGAVGINFEDQVVDGQGLYDITEQSHRIRAIRQCADALGVPLYINARTDLFLKASSRAEHGGLIDSAKERADAFAAAGASGVFLPGLIDTRLITSLCEHTSLPVNIMMLDGAPSIAELAACGVSRVSFGPAPYFQAMAALQQSAEQVLR